MLFNLLNTGEKGNSLIPILAGNILTSNVCWMRPIRSASRGICWRAQKVELPVELCNLWRCQLESQTNHICTDRITLTVLLFLLLPLAHPRQSAKNSYWSLQSQVTGMSKDSDAFFLHAESYTVLKEHRNYYTMSMVLFIYLFSKWLLYTLIQALHLEEICIHGGKKSFLNVVIEHCPWSVTNWLWKSYPRGLL